jgi:Domain of unknown function DUF29
MGSQTTKVRPVKPATGYKDDVFTWVWEQVALLRAGRLSEVDALNVAEELSDVGNEIYFRLESSFVVLTQHYLKWDHQPGRRSLSWQFSIDEQRRRIAKLLRKNPGLKSEIAEALADGYLDGRARAIVETKIAKSKFPATCPYTFDELMTRVIELDD